MNDFSRVLRRWLIGLGILVLFFVTVWKLESLATLILFSFLVAYVLNPLVTRIDRVRFISRATAALITLLGLLLCLSLMLIIIVPEVVIEFKLFLHKMPSYVDRMRETLIPIVERTLNVRFPSSLGEFLDLFSKHIREIAPKIIGPLTSALAFIFGGTFSILFAIVGTLMFPLFLFLLLKDFPRIIQTVDGLIPTRYKEKVHGIAIEVDKSLSAFLHGQFLVMLVLGTLYSIGYSIVGIPVAIGIGALTGMLCFIPYVGAATGFVLALLLSALEYEGMGRILGVVAVFGTVQALDAVLITPKIIGGKLGLRPLWIIVALMAGAELFGFLGVLLAVPAMAVLKVLTAHVLARYKRSSIYLNGSETEARKNATGE